MLNVSKIPRFRSSLRGRFIKPTDENDDEVWSPYDGTKSLTIARRVANNSKYRNGVIFVRVLSALTTLALLATVAVAQESGPKGIPVGAVNWGPAPDALPKGGELAALSGDPGKSGWFTVRLKMPGGYKIPAHQHPHTERITVISGELEFGTGDKLDEKQANKLGPGGFVDLPANTNHYAFANVPTVIQITGEGPFGIKYVNLTDDPSKKK